MQYFLQYLLSCSTTRHPQCCSLGKPQGLCVRLSVHCFHQLLFSENCFEVVPTDDRSCSWLQHLCPRPVSKLPTLKLSWRGHTLIHFNGCQHLLCQRTSLSDSKNGGPSDQGTQKKQEILLNTMSKNTPAPTKWDPYYTPWRFTQYPCVWSSSAIISKHTHIYIYITAICIYIYIYIYGSLAPIAIFLESLCMHTCTHTYTHYT